MIIKGIVDNLNRSDIEFVIGVATGGISWGAWISEKLDVPFGYVRSSKKDYGVQNTVEGDIDFNKNILVIEDVVSTGNSLGRAIKMLKDSSSKSLIAFSIFSYQFPESLDLFNKLEVEFNSLLTIEGLIEYASDKIGDDIKEIQNWKNNPREWRTQ